MNKTNLLLACTIAITLLAAFMAALYFIYSIFDMAYHTLFGFGLISLFRLIGKFRTGEK